MCMCRDFSLCVLFPSSVYLAPRKGKPAQIRLNPESSCLSVKYFRKQTCIYLLTQCAQEVNLPFFERQEITVKIDTYTIACFPLNIFTLSLVSQHFLFTVREHRRRTGRLQRLPQGANSYQVVLEQHSFN